MKPKKKELISNEYEVTLFLTKSCWQIKRNTCARNEYEAVLEVANDLSGNFDLYWNDDDFEVVSVVRADLEREA